MSASLADLPAELFQLVLDHVVYKSHPKQRNRDLIAIGQCSKRLNDLVMPTLYKKLVITRKSADLLFLGVPRRAKPKASTKSKLDIKNDRRDWLREYEDELFIFDYDAGFDETLMPTVEDDDSEPETDDDEVPDHASVVARTAAVTWERRRQLLAHCTHLIVLQVPSTALVTDLVDACEVQIPQPRVFANMDEYLISLEGEEEASGGSRGENKLPASKRNRIPNYIDQVCDSTIFPNLANICMSWRVVRYTNNWSQNPFIKGGGCVPERGAHPFLHLVKHTFGSPTNLCIVSPPEDKRAWIALDLEGDTPQFDLHTKHVFRWTRHWGGDGLKNIQLATHWLAKILTERIGVHEQHVLDSVNSANVSAVCVHALSWPGEAMQLKSYDNGDTKMEHDGTYGMPFVDIKDRQVLHRYYYCQRLWTSDPTPDRVAAITWAVSQTAPQPGQTTWPVFENVDASRGVYRDGHAHEVPERVLTRLTTDPACVLRAPADFEPSDNDATADAAATKAKNAFTTADEQLQQFETAFRAERAAPDETERLQKAVSQVRRLRNLARRDAERNAALVAAETALAENERLTTTWDCVATEHEALQSTRKRTMEESTVAEEEAGMARSVKRARRLGAEHDPRSRIKFLTEPQSDPCVVCRYRHAEEYRQHLDREVAKAWNPPAYSAEGLYIGDEFEVEPPNPNSEDGSQITEDSPWGNGYNENYEITTTDDSNNTSEDGTSSNSVVSDEGLDLSSEDDDEKEGLADHSECYKLGYPCLCGGGDDVDHLQCWKVGAPCGCEL